MANTALTKPQAGDEVTAVWGQGVADAANGIQYGSAVISINASTQGSVTVTFPRAYATAPAVVAMMVSAAGASLGLITQANAITATTATLRLSSTAGSLTVGPLAIGWIAIGVPA